MSIFIRFSQNAEEATYLILPSYFVSEETGTERPNHATREEDGGREGPQGGDGQFRGNLIIAFGVRFVEEATDELKPMTYKIDTHVTSPLHVFFRGLGLASYV